MVTLFVLIMITLLTKLDVNIARKRFDQIPKRHEIDFDLISGDNINIHLIGHSHDDTGWLVTVDQYYIDIIQWIFYSMIPSLQLNPLRKFTYVEMAFFWRWWINQDVTTKNIIKKLLDSKQLELNLQGWCMNDEAAPTMSQEIRQMTDGAQFSLYNFGENARAKVGWHIDPFGSSFVTAGLWSQIGFDTFGINRINYLDLQQRKQDKNLEFIWKGSNSLGQESYIFTHILDSFYCSPNEIWFHGIFDLQRNGGNPINDVCVEEFTLNVWLNAYENLPSYKSNIQSIADNFISDIRQRSKYYVHNNVLVPFGCDFAHTNMQMSFNQMDELIDYIHKNNQRYNATVIYSSLYDYTLSVNALNITWNLEDNDFFDYAIGPHQWWVGFFTSRPDLKLYTRLTGNILRTSEFLYTFAKNNKNTNLDEKNAMNNITLLRHAQDVAQHHDAITGTAADYVNNDYKNMIKNGVDSVLYFSNDLISHFLGKNTSNNYKAIFELDVSVEILHKLTTSNIVPLALYNSLSWKVTQLIKIATNQNDLIVYDGNENIVTSQINPVVNNTDPFSKAPSKYNLYFIATDLIPLSITTYFIKKANTEKEILQVNFGKIKQYKYGTDNGDNYQTGNGYYSLQFDGTTNLLTSITNNGIGKTLNISQNYMQYGSMGTYSGWFDNDDITDDPWQLRPAQDNRYQILQNQDAQNMIEIDGIKFRQFDPKINVNKIGFLTQSHVQGQTLDISQIHICDIDPTSSTFNLQYFPVVNSNPCDGNYDANWLVFGDENIIDNNGYFDNKYSATMTINKNGNSATNSINIDLSSYNFVNIPMIFTSIRKTSCNDQQSYYSSIITDVTTKSVTISITRIDSNSAWIDDSVFLDYVVFDTSLQINNDISTIESVQLISSNQASYQTDITFKNKNFVVNEPIIMIQLISTDKDKFDYASTVTQNNKNGFTLNLQLFNNNKGSTSFTVNYWAFERIVMKQAVSKQITNNIITGPVLNEVQQIFDTNYSQTYLLFNNNTSFNDDLKYIENTFYLGWINDYTNLVSSFNINNVDSNNTIYTCQNSLEYIARHYDPYCDERISCNLWPTSSQSYVSLDKLDEYRFSTIMNFAHGTLSLGDGNYELLLQRRCATDNTYWFPSGCMNPSTDMMETNYLFYDESQQISYLNRRLYQLQQYKPLQFYTLFDGTISDWKKIYNVQWTAMNKSGEYYPNGLPKNIHLLDLRYAYSGNQNQDENNGMLLQLWNMFEINENKQYSINETINLQSIFDNNYLDLQFVTEMTLTANLPLNKLNRLKWKYKINDDDDTFILDKDNKYKKLKLEKEVEALEIVMNPRNIRTFVVNQVIN